MPSQSSFNKAQWVAMKGLSLLTNDLQVSPYFSDEYSGDYAQKFAIGSTMQVPLSQRYTVQQNDMTYNPQAFDRPYTTITVDQTRSIPLEWESIEKALDMERGEENVERIYLKPAIAYLRQELDSYCAQFAYQNTSMVTGVLGTNPTTFDATSAACKQALDEMGCPTDTNELGLMVPPAVMRAVKTGAIGLFNPQNELSKAFRTGQNGTSDGFDWYSSNSLYTHTAGTWAGAVTLSAANQSGSSITVTCTTGDTFKKGDKISIANVNSVNMMTRRTTSTSSAGTKTFTILADATGVASAATLSIFPAIYGPGSHYQNVDALGANSAALTLWPGTSSPSGKVGKVGLALYPGAFFLVGMKLEEPEAVEICRQYQDPKTGVAVRFIRQWSNERSAMTNRFDMLFGAGVGLADQCSVCLACA
jgi:hypothetical protein